MWTAWTSQLIGQVEELYIGKRGRLPLPYSSHGASASSSAPGALAVRRLVNVTRRPVKPISYFSRSLPRTGSRSGSAAASPRCPASRARAICYMPYDARGASSAVLPHVPTTHNVPSLDPSPMWRLPVTGSGAFCGATTQSYFDRLRGVTGRPELRAVQHNARPPSLHAVQHDAHAEARRPVPGRMNWPHASRRRRAHPAGRHRRSSISCSL